VTSHPTVVVGIDGAHFQLIEPWLAEGALPNIQGILEEGCAGDLRSVLPPVTSPNWKAYATGKNPGKIGIFWWENVDTEAQRVFYPTARKHANRELWELLAAEHNVGVVNVPTTYPPKACGEFLIAGPPDGENTDFTHPAALEDRLREDFDYRVLKERRLDGDRETAAEEILELIDLRFEVARTLYAEDSLDFLQVTTFYINSLQHFLWDHVYTRRGWERIDEHVGWFRDRDCNVMLMSDHGSNPIETVFNVNAWLEREGYLVTDTGVADSLFRVGITTDRLVRLTTRLGLSGLAKRLAPRRLLAYLPDESGAVNKEGKTDTIVWDETDAVASGQGPIYLTVDRENPAYNPLREELSAALESLTDPDGNAVASSVEYGEDVYEGPYSDEAPDLVVDQATGVHIPGGLGQAKVFTSPSDGGWRAENKRDGLFAAIGPDFSSGELDPLSILDLAPTLLHLFECPIPADMDGEVRRDVFASDARARERPPAWREPDAHRTEVERIRRIARRLDL